MLVETALRQTQCSDNHHDIETAEAGDDPAQKTADQSNRQQRRDAGQAPYSVSPIGAIEGYFQS